MKPDNRPVFESEEWKKLIAAPVTATKELERDLIRKLDENDVSGLIAYLAIATGKEQYTVLGIFDVAIRITPARSKRRDLLDLISLTSEQALDLKVALYTLLKKRDSAGSAYAIMLFQQLDHAAASQYLLGLDGFSWYLPRSVASMDRALQHTGPQDPYARDAVKRLRHAGIVDQKEVEALAIEWRRSKPLQVLNELFEFHISRLFGKPIELLFEVLGPPLLHTENGYNYYSATGGGYFFTSDKNGNLDGWKSIDGLPED
jgi:hypothetical protein